MAPNDSHHVSLLPYHYPKAKSALPLWLRLIFTLLLRIGTLLGWAMGGEPLTFGAVIGTLCTTTTAATYSLNSTDPTVPLVSGVCVYFSS